MFAFKAILNGDCLFNVIFFFVRGNELVVMFLRFLVVGELYFNVLFYVYYYVFVDIIRFNSDFFLDILFIVVFIEVGVDECSKIRSKIDVVKFEVLVVCIRGEWSLFFYILGVVFVFFK